MAEQRTRFVGTYDHGLDDKGRMVLPAKIRAQLGETGLLGKLDGCIGLWTVEGFDAAADEMQALADAGSVTVGALRAFIADAHEIVPDQQGRIVIPSRLRQYGGLGSDVVIIGRMKRAEIWDAATWHAMSDANDAELHDAVKTHGF